MQRANPLFLQRNELTYPLRLGTNGRRFRSISYEAKGKQHVAAAARLHSPIWPVKGGPVRVVVYTLP